jgi:hypothetical protein
MVTNDENVRESFHVDSAIHHAKNPSFNLTSDLSRQMNGNQSVSESKYLIKSGQTSIDMASALLGHHRPKEIEELFESTRNFYQNKQHPTGVGYKDN